MVRLSRRQSHEQKRPRRLAAPTSLQDPLLDQNFWHELINEYDDADGEYDEQNELFLEEQSRRRKEIASGGASRRSSAPPPPSSRRNNAEASNLITIPKTPLIRLKSTGGHLNSRDELAYSPVSRRSERYDRQRATTTISSNGYEPGMVVLKMRRETLRRIKKGVRTPGTPRINLTNKLSAAVPNGDMQATKTIVREVIEEIEDSDEEPYRGTIKGLDADTHNTMPTELDERRFEHALEKSRHEDTNDDDDIQQGDSHQILTRQNVSKIRKIHIGEYEIDTWYTAPYPEEYSQRSVLPLCEFCLKYMGSDYVAWRHRLKCQYKHPPGQEIYRHGKNSIFEVDGRKMPLYCQNLCLLAKMFLDSKTLYYDVDPFMFYVLTENDDFGCHFVGYFSKQKAASSVGGNAYNVSCILTLPTAQRKGYGSFLIDFSYLLTRHENTTGTPEKPLSSLGLASYTNYWKLVLCYQLKAEIEQMQSNNQATLDVSIARLSKNTGMTLDDVVFGLEQLEFLAYDATTAEYVFKVDRDVVESTISKWEAKNYLALYPERLMWTPLISTDPRIAPLAERPRGHTRIDDEDPAEILDRLQLLQPPPLAPSLYIQPDSAESAAAALNAAARSANNRSRLSSRFFIKKMPSSSLRSPQARSYRSRAVLNPDGTARPRGRPKGAIAIDKLAKVLKVSLKEAAAIRERDRVAYMNGTIKEFPDYLHGALPEPVDTGIDN